MMHVVVRSSRLQDGYPRVRCADRGETGGVLELESRGERSRATELPTGGRARATGCDGRCRQEADTGELEVQMPCEYARGRPGAALG